MDIFCNNTFLHFQKMIYCNLILSFHNFAKIHTVESQGFEPLKKMKINCLKNWVQV